MRETAPRFNPGEDWKSLPSSDKVIEKGTHLLERFLSEGVEYPNMLSKQESIMRAEQFFASAGLPEASVSIDDSPAGTVTWKVSVKSPIHSEENLTFSHEQTR